MRSAFRFGRCVQAPSRSLVQLGQLHFPSHDVVGPASTRRHSCAFVPHTAARNIRNRFRMSSTGEELSKYSADDPRGARAISNLGAVVPELHGNASGSPFNTGATSLASALRAPSIVV